MRLPYNYFFYGYLWVTDLNFKLSIEKKIEKVMQILQ